MTDMKRVNDEQIDLCGWEFVTKATGIEAIVMRGFASMITDILRKRFEDDPPFLTLPAWGGYRRKAGDPLTLYLELPLGEPAEDFNRFTYACTLEEAIDGVTSQYESPDGSKHVGNDKKGREDCRKIVARLRELADKLDAACARTP
jgi:hypothetical protein